MAGRIKLTGRTALTIGVQEVAYQIVRLLSAGKITFIIQRILVIAAFGRPVTAQLFGCLARRRIERHLTRHLIGHLTGQRTWLVRFGQTIG